MRMRGYNGGDDERRAQQGSNFRRVEGALVKRRRLLRRLSQGLLRNVSFAELTDLVAGFGFRLARIKGSHHSFTHPGVPELINLQNERLSH